MAWRLSGRFWYLASLLIAGFLALGAGLVWTNYKTFRNVEAGLVAIREFQTALTLYNRLGAERDVTIANVAEHAGAPRNVRLATDDALAALLAELSESRQDAQERASLERLRTQISAVRAAGDADSGRTAASDGSAGPDLFKKFSTLIEAANVTLEASGTRAILRNPAQSPAIAGAMQAARLRMLAGDLLAEHLDDAAGWTVSPRAEPSFAVLRARLGELRDTVALTIQPLLADRDISAAWAEAKQGFFDRAFPLLDAPGAGRGGASHLNASELLARVNPELRTLDGVQREVMRSSLSVATRGVETARRSLAVVAGTSVAILLCLVLIIVGIQRFLFQPLLYVRDQLMALTLGNSGELRMPSAGSEEMREVLTALRLLRESQRARLAVERERDELNARLKRLAETDALTGLLNRRALEDTLSQRREEVTGFDGALAVILLDLDYFKKVNDVHGHIAGDRVLQEAAERIRRCVRPVDVAARYGGEEFAIVVAQPNHELLTSLAEKIRQSIEASPFDAGPELRLPVTASLGASIGHGSDGWTYILNTADQALYRAKNEGRNRTVFTRAALRRRAA